MQILVAEDDYSSRCMLTSILEKNGHEPVLTTDGVAAWEIMQRQDAPKIAVIDWMMPEMDGTELIRRIRQISTEQPPYLLMLTAKRNTDDVVTGLDCGADDYVVKPFEVKELRARLDVGRRLVEMQENLVQRLEELRRAYEQIKTLEGILPICMYCKKIRDDEGYWDQVEQYISSHSHAKFSHSVCPECMNEYFPELSDSENNDSEEKE